MSDVLHLSSRADAEEILDSATAWEQHVPKQVKLDEIGVYFAMKLLGRSNLSQWYAADFDAQGYLRISRLPHGSCADVALRRVKSMLELP